MVGVICGLGFGKSRVFGHADFDGNLNLDDYRGASEARIRWFHKQRLADVTCQTNAATFDWANQAMALSRAVLKPDMCGAIEAPVLLFQAGRDVWVLNGPQDDFVERVREGGGSIEKCDTASHCTKFSPCRMLCSDHISAKSSIFVSAERKLGGINLFCITDV